jgi:protein SSD1
MPNRGAHRRVQSTAPVPGMGGPGSQQGLMSQLGLGNIGLDGQPQGIPRGHGRRHSVNVLNKSASQSSVSGLAGFQDTGFDDGFVAPSALGGHSRQASRADSSWRMSKWLNVCGIYRLTLRFRWWRRWIW